MKKYFSIFILWFVLHLLTLYVAISTSTKDFINLSFVEVGFWFVVVTIPFLVFLIYSIKVFKLKTKTPLFYFIPLLVLVFAYVLLSINAIPSDNSQKDFFLLTKWLFLGGQIILSVLVYYVFLEQQPKTVLTENKDAGSANEISNSIIELNNLENELELLLKKQGAYNLKKTEGGLSFDQEFKLEQDLLTMNDRIIAIKEQIQVLINNPV